jgi:hypothetical protein
MLPLLKKRTTSKEVVPFDLTIYLLPEHTGMGQHLLSVGQVFASQHLSLLHSIFAFFLAFFFPPLAKEGEVIRAIASNPKNIFFIFK